MSDAAGKARALVCVVDDDESVREALPDLLRTIGFASLAFASGQEFLASGQVEQIACLVLDVAMPGMSGPELHAELRRRGHCVPVVFITAHTDPALVPRLLQAGAAACLIKPFSDSELLATVTTALASR